MNSYDVISQLKSLKDIEPNENWVVSAREKVLTYAPISGVTSTVYSEKPTMMDEIMYLFESVTRKYKYVPSLATVAFIVLASGFFTITAAKTSLPGDPLYSVKLANENMVLAVTSDEDKPEVEMEIAGKRLEELAQVSLAASDSAQQEKVEQLVNNFQEKVTSANDKMTKISQKSEKKKVAKVAKVINNQTEKYKELLSKTSESLPTVVKDKVNEKITSAMSINDKVNTDSLLILIESNNDIDIKEISDEELTSIILKKVEGMTESGPKSEVDKSGSVSGTGEVEATDNRITISEGENLENASGAISVKDQKTALIESINQNIKDNNLAEAVKDFVEIQNMENKTATTTNLNTNVPADDAQNNTDTNTAVDDTNGTKNSGSDDGKVKIEVNPVPVE